MRRSRSFRRSSFVVTLSGLIGAVVGVESAAHAQTGTFLDRQAATDLRVATFNVFNDSILTSRRGQFARIANAVRPELWAFQEFYETGTNSILTLLNDAQPAAPGRSWNVYRFGEHVIASQYALTLTAANTSPGGYRAIAMAKIDLPDAHFATDLYLMNAHYRCCGGNDVSRQMQSDALVNWMRDARTPGGNITLDPGTAMMVLGDLNLVDGHQPLTTLLDGDIVDAARYGPAAAPDWDGSTNAVADAYQNAVAGGPQWTWRSDGSGFDPGRLDFVTYTDSVLTLRNNFALNTVAMTAADRAATGVMSYDTTLNQASGSYDHLPVVTDFAGPLPGDLDGDLDRDADDIDLLQSTTPGVTAAGNWRADVLRNGNIVTAAEVAGSDLDALVRTLLATQYGDATLDRRVDFDDLLSLAQHYGSAESDLGWADGDFNGDDGVDFDDLLVLARFYGFGTTSAVEAARPLIGPIADDWALARSLVPEPAGICALSPAVATFCRRRRVR